MDTDEKSKNKEVWFIVVVLLAIAVVVFIYWRQPQKIQQTENQSQKPEIPKELILGQEINSQVALDFPDPNKVNFVQYRTTQTLKDLVTFYSKAFSENGWFISENGNVKQGLYNIIAENKQSGILANITMLLPSNTQKKEQSLGGEINSILVAITFRKK